MTARLTHPRPRLIVPALVLSLAGCAAAVDPAPGGGEAEALLGVGVDVGAAATTSAAIGVARPPICDRARQIGELAYGFACPAPSSSSWTVRPLFRVPTGNPILDRRSAPFAVSSHGAGYCLYEYVGDPLAYSRTGLPYDDSMCGSDDVCDTRSPSEWLDSDCAVVAALGDTDDALAAITDDYERAYRRQIGALSAYPALASPVEIALIDSSPDSGLTTIEPTIGSMLHGRAIGMAIRSVAFPAGTAATQRIPFFHSWQALGSERRAYIGDLAGLIERAVRSRRGDTGNRLILNLSLGYHPEFGTIPTSDDVYQWRIHTRAILAALNYATCRGAIAIVAAGNSEEGPEPDGRAMYPAALGSNSAWTCSTSPTPRWDVPLAYPASGVDAFDRDLPNARNEARAPLVAPAFAVAVADPSVALPPMTGSSFGAAGVSAVAALVWGYHPTASPQEVMSIVHESGVELSTYADFCHGTALSCGRQRRVSACRAVAAALGARCGTGDAAACSAAASMPRCASSPSAPITVDPSELTSSTTPRRPRFVAADVDSAACGGTRYTERGLDPAAADMCAQIFYENGLHLEVSGPQPGEVPCRVCALGRATSSAWLYMGLDPAWRGKLSSGSLTIATSKYALSSTTISTSFDTTAKVLIPYTGTISLNTVAYLSFRTTSGASVLVPLPIW
jgi:hypothetical protein